MASGVTNKGSGLNLSEAFFFIFLVDSVGKLALLTPYL